MNHPVDTAAAYLADRPVLSGAQWRMLSVLGPLVVAAAGWWLATAEFTTGPLERLENVSLDWRFRVRGPRVPRSDIVIVEIDEASRRELRDGLTRFNFREHLPAAIDNLADAGALVIALDFWLDDLTDPEVDQRLADTIAAANTVLAVTHTDGRLIRAAPLFLAVSEEGFRPDEGAITVYPDADGLLRRLPESLHLDVLTPDHQLLRVPHFPLVAAMYWLNARDPAAQIAWETSSVRLGDRLVRAREPIDFAAPRGGGWTTLSFADAVLNRLDTASIDGSIVLVGESRSIVDQFTLPLGDGLNPGVYYHANVIAQILDGRHFVTSWSERPRRNMVICGLGLAAGLFAWYPRRWWTHRRGGMALAGYVLAGVVLFVGGWSLTAVLLFERNVLAPLVAPLIVMGLALGTGWVAQWIIVSANTRRLMERNQRIEALFGRNVSHNVLNALKADPAGIMETRVREVSVLFCDLRGFTAAAADLPPERVAAMLNEYFNHITAAVIAHDGFVDKFVGDEIMAVFSVPLPQVDHADRAVRTAVQIKRELAALNVTRSERGQAPLDCGVGIHTGPAAAGHIGSADRSNYTVVGATVNLAARIQSLSKGGEILISQTTRERLMDATDVALWNKVDIRGLEGTHEVYQVKA